MIMVCTFRDDFRQQIVPFLNERGYDVCVPSHRQDVLAMAIQQQPLAVLLDMYVSHPSGLDVLRELRSHGFRGKVVLLGGSSMSGVISQAHQLGVDQVVGGPQWVDGPATFFCGQIEAAIHATLHASIAVKAYEIYQARGRAQGQDLDDWLEAERFVFKRGFSKKSVGQPSRTALKETQSQKSQLHITLLSDEREAKK
ncbi:MAG: hypothetical protein NPIRA05_16510 [Nitrospirales bacterium]|nr:MAG: hypothetical protein NPIRA05_16510 [Nitrospirales bacterium]